MRFSEKSACSSTWHVDTVQLLVTNTEWTYLLQITFIHGFSEEAPWMTCTLIFTFDLLDDVNLSSEVYLCKHFDKYHVCPLCTNLFITVSTNTMVNIITTTIQDQIIPNVTNQTFRSVSFPWPVPPLPSSRPWWAWNLKLWKPKLCFNSVKFSISGHHWLIQRKTTQVRQDRNVHDYLADLDSEVPLYMKVKDLLLCGLNFLSFIISCVFTHCT